MDAGPEKAEEPMEEAGMTNEIIQKVSWFAYPVCMYKMIIVRDHGRGSQITQTMS